MFVAFEFPPLGGGGVQRSMKFAKYLPQFGITPVVLTTDEASFRQVMSGHPIDVKLLEDLPAGLPIERIACPRAHPEATTKFGEWRRIFFSLVEEQGKYWRSELRRELPRLLQKHQPKVIYVSLPPFSMGPLWLELSRQAQLPLMLDFRDGWTQWRISPYGTWLHYQLAVRLERRCLGGARRVICTSEQTRRDFLRVHPGIPPEKITVITNGYDHDISDWSLSEAIGPGREAFHRVPALAGSQGRGGTRPYLPEELDRDGPVASGCHCIASRPFTIGYVGNFYYSPTARGAMLKPWWRKRPNRMIQYAPRKEDWLYRSPYFFFRAVARLLADQPDLRARLRMRFAGNKPDWIDAQAAQFGLGGMVEFLGYLDHPSVLAFQQECDCLLVTSSKVIGGQDYSIAGKTFEYFSLRKPILGFVTEGAQKDILVQSGLAVICDPDSPAESARKLDDLISGRIRLQPNAAFLKTLHRRELTRKLADVLRDAALCPLPSAT